MTAAYIREDISMKKLRRNALIIMCAAGMALTASCAAKVDETVEQTEEESVAETTAALETAAPASEVSIAYEGIIDTLRAVRSGDAFPCADLRPGRTASAGMLHVFPVRKAAAIFPLAQ